MGLDYGFFKQNEVEVLGFSGHGMLFDMICDEPYVRLHASTDFYVTRPMIAAVLAKIEREIEAHGLPLVPLPPVGTARVDKIADAIPPKFYWTDPEDWATALPCYRILLIRLLEEVRQDGCLICGWSA